MWLLSSTTKSTAPRRTAPVSATTKEQDEKPRANPASTTAVTQWSLAAAWRDCSPRGFYPIISNW